MRDPDQPSSNSFLRALGIVICAAVGQAVLADPDEAAPMQDAPAAPPVAAAMTGQQVYNAVCIACHAPPGVGGAPALGDGNAWAGRVAQGMEALIEHALNGYSGSTGIMPRKGGRTDLSDEEIIGAIEYMVGQFASEQGAQ